MFIIFIVVAVIDLVIGDTVIIFAVVSVEGQFSVGIRAVVLIL